ncbi:MAG: VWA domain-containing protein, partial [Kiritimatiellae bacterium]|nr:VWA domain-containing protein [Kiritimatiellia bacterium]
MKKTGHNRIHTRLLAGVAGLLTLTATSHGAGLLIADGGFGGQLQIIEHEVRVSINNGVAVTKVVQVFQNQEDRQVEALYTFPVPRGASVANFSMWINGKEMVGEVLEKEKAREIYNSYKQVRRDPGLLEQVDFRTFEMRIFPIGPKAEQRVEITYYQELESDHDTLRYVYPLATATQPTTDTRVHGRLSFQADVRSLVAMEAMGSPSHPADAVVAMHGPDYGQLSLEQRDGDLNRDLVLTCKLRRAKTGLDLITSREKGEDGYFQMTLTAGEDLAALDESMDYVFVLDISGSMANDGKLGVSRESILAFVDGLAAEDRFELISFNVQPNPLFGSLRPAVGNAGTEARRFLDNQSARGGTVLRPALLTAYKYANPDRVLNVVVLSDGLTEQRDRAELLQVIGQRPSGCRVFCIGVGNDVNRPLLEQIADDAGGLAAFLSHGDNYEQAAKAFRRKLMRPVAANLAIKIEGVDTYDLEPAVLPNLFHGMPIRVYGRYRGEGKAQVSLTGDVRGKAFGSEDTMTFPARDDANPEIERMWAWKRIDQLQKKADRSGSRDSVIGEIVELGETYSIVTEYTSFLVLENDSEYQRWKIDRKNARRIGRDRAAQQAREEKLRLLRELALAGLGPDAAKAAPQPQQLAAAQPTRPSQPGQPSVQAPTQPRNQGRSIDLNIGTGPV